MASIFWKPSTPFMRAFQTSAIPPVAIFSSRTYWPKRMPSTGSSSSAGAGVAAAAGGKTGCEAGTFSEGSSTGRRAVVYFGSVVGCTGGCTGGWTGDDGAGGGVAGVGGGTLPAFGFGRWRGSLADRVFV